MTKQTFRFRAGRKCSNNEYTLAMKIPFPISEAELWLVTDALQQRGLAAKIQEGIASEEITAEKYWEAEKLRRIVQPVNSAVGIFSDHEGRPCSGVYALTDISPDSLFLYSYGDQQQHLNTSKEVTIKELCDSDFEAQKALRLIKSVHKSISNEDLKTLIPTESECKKYYKSKNTQITTVIRNNLFYEQLKKFTIEKLSNEAHNNAYNTLSELTNYCEIPEVIELFILSINKNGVLKQTDAITIDIPYSTIKLLYTRLIQSKDKRPGDPIRANEPLIWFLYHKPRQERLTSDLQKFISIHGTNRSYLIHKLCRNILLMHYKTYLHYLPLDTRKIILQLKDEIAENLRKEYENYYNDVHFAHIFKLCIDPKLSPSNLCPSTIRLFSPSPNSKLLPIKLSEQLLELYYTYDCRNCDELACRLAALDRVGLLEELNEKGISYNTADSKGRTLLIHAVMHGRAAATKFLLKQKATATTRDSNGKNAMAYTKIIRNQDVRETIQTLLLTDMHKILDYIFEIELNDFTFQNSSKASYLIVKQFETKLEYVSCQKLAEAIRDSSSPSSSWASFCCSNEREIDLKILAQKICYIGIGSEKNEACQPKASSDHSQILKQSLE